MLEIYIKSYQKTLVKPQKNFTMIIGSPTNVANVATLDIPVATLILLEQAFSHIS